MDTSPLVSIITVTYRAQEVLPLTLESVASQTLAGIEHILVDGASPDNTPGQIAAYAAQAPYPVRWVSEKDQGLYDAMNKGLAMAGGEWVCFMNAGDCFYTSDTLAQALDQATDTTDVLYGHTMMVDAQGRELGLRSHKKLPSSLHWRHFRQGMVVGHQALLVRRRIAQTYDLQYRYSGDIDWSIRTLKQAREIRHTGLIIDRFLEGGVSHTRRKEALKERWHIIRRHYGWLTALWVHLGIGLRFLLRGGKLR
ncbi:MAG: glycosyltransferase [Bacteroidetes bacterium]|nr:glycosyltransferase [Bacteroidota bacterium]